MDLFFFEKIDGFAKEVRLCVNFLTLRFVAFFHKQAEGAGEGPTETEISASEKRGSKDENEIEIERRPKHIETRRGWVTSFTVKPKGVPEKCRERHTVQKKHEMFYIRGYILLHLNNVSAVSYNDLLHLYYLGDVLMCNQRRLT